MKHKNVTYLAILISFLLATASSALAQEQHDSILLNKYQLLCNTYENENADSLLKYASIQLIISKKNNSTDHQIKAYTNLGIAYSRLFKFNDALSCYLMARNIIETTHSMDMSPLLGKIGYIYLRLNRNKESYKFFKLQQSTSLKENNHQSYLNSCINLSDYYNMLNQLDSTILVLNTALPISRKYKDHDNEVIILDNIANAYYTKALEHKDVALFKKVQLYADSALAFHFQESDSSGIFYIYGLLGALNMELGNYSKSENYYNQYISYSKRTQDIINLKIAVDELSFLFARQGKFEKAYEYRLMYDSINRLYVNEEVNKHVEELNTKYETEKKEQQNVLLKKQNDLSEETIKQQNTIVYFIITSLVISVMFGFFMFRVYSQKKKAHLLITKQKEEVESKQFEIEHQKQVIEEKQKEILDSINYAKRIQYALLAHHEILDANLYSHFTLFKPKDIVSGDFYWAAEVTALNGDSLFYLACCDSTGHGVPGAFMSLLNMGFLGEAIKEKHIYEPNKIFDFVRKKLIENISSDGQQDGFDGVLLCINKSKSTITYTAANNTPLLISGNSINKLPSDKMPVGKGERVQNFNLHTINYLKGDTIYLYTDGFQDQFGGPKGKKFKYKQLEQLFLSNAIKPMQEQQHILKNTLEHWQGHLEQVDDVCIIGFRL